MTERISAEEFQKKVAKKPRRSEHDEQAKLFRLAKIAAPAYPEFAELFAVPNGGKRSSTTGNMLRSEGVKRGVPDILLLIPRGKFHGLAIEMKVRPNKVSAEQQAWLDTLTQRGYYAVVCWSCKEAWSVIAKYIYL